MASDSACLVRCSGGTKNRRWFRNYVVSPLDTLPFFSGIRTSLPLKVRPNHQDGGRELYEAHCALLMERMDLVTYEGDTEAGDFHRCVLVATTEQPALPCWGNALATS
jgi:hypothetical protein